MRIFKTLSNSELIKSLKDGQVGVIPTDTIYGIVCIASNQESVTRLYSLKSRSNKPGTVIAASIDQLVELGIKRRYLKAVEQFWPGSVSIEIPHGISYLNQGTGRQAFRIPEDKDVRSLLEKVGPLQTTSANLPNNPNANNIKEAQKYFGNLVDFYVDGGDLSGRPASTIIRVIDDAVEIIRQGATKIEGVS
jgi:L-threonylcarbamoyladenylate synthase